MRPAETLWFDRRLIAPHHDPAGWFASKVPGRWASGDANLDRPALNARPLGDSGVGRNYTRPRGPGESASRFGDLTDARLGRTYPARGHLRRSQVGFFTEFQWAPGMDEAQAFDEAIYHFIRPSERRWAPQRLLCVVGRADDLCPRQYALGCLYAAYLYR